jgi:hypothetical protein
VLSGYSTPKYSGGTLTRGMRSWGLFVKTDGLGSAWVQWKLDGNRKRGDDVSVGSAIVVVEDENCAVASSRCIVVA